MWMFQKQNWVMVVGLSALPLFFGYVDFCLVCMLVVEWVRCMFMYDVPDSFLFLFGRYGSIAGDGREGEEGGR